MADFNFDNRVGRTTNIAKSELIKKLKIDNYGLEYEADQTARLNVMKIISFRFLETFYFDENGDRETTNVFDVELATCAVTKARNVVVTPILNENGSVKQIVGQQDYMITINGFLIGNHNQPQNLPITSQENFETEYAKPTEQIEELRAILETNVSLNIQSAFLDQFNIENIVVQSFSFSQDFETKNIQEFSIKAISDDPKIRFI